MLEDHASMGQVGKLGIVLLFAVLKGLHMAVFAWLAGPLMNASYALPGVAALWAGLGRTHATFGFTWMQLGNAGIDMSLPLRLAPVVGVYGVVICLCHDGDRRGLPGAAATADEACSAAGSAVALRVAADTTADAGRPATR